MTQWLHWSWWTSEQRWFHVERPFPWPLILSLLALVAVLAWILW